MQSVEERQLGNADHTCHSELRWEETKKNKEHDDVRKKGQSLKL